MQKKIIALAVAGLMSGAAFAQSNVTIYGVMHASWDRINTDVTNADKLRRVNSNFSRIGFKGTESLGNGLAANFQIEQQVDTDNDGAATAFGGAGLRNTYVGLSSKTLGEFRMGNHDTPYKMSTGSLDAFGDTAGDYNAIVGSFVGNNQGFDKRANNSITYLSPMFNGVQVTAHYGHDQETSNNTATVDLDNASNYGIAATYANGPLFASLAWERHNFAGAAAATPGGFDVTGTKLGLGYTFMGTTKVGLVYEHLNGDAENDASAANIATSKTASRNAWGVNVAHTMGAIVLKAAYFKANEGDTAANDNTGAKNWALGLDYNMSKRTQAYAVYTKTTNESAANYGLGHGFYTNAAGANLGKDPSAISFGLKHSF